eukprot:6905347-Prymnesium_polylepis.1
MDTSSYGVSRKPERASSHQQLRSPRDVPSGVALRGRTERAHQTGPGGHIPRRDNTRDRSARAINAPALRGLKW